MFESSPQVVGDYLYDQPTDMRKSFDTLRAVVKHKVGQDLLRLIEIY